MLFPVNRMKGGMEQPMDAIITFVDTANQLFTTIVVFGVGIII